MLVVRFLKVILSNVGCAVFKVILSNVGCAVFKVILSNAGCSVFKVIFSNVGCAVLEVILSNVGCAVFKHRSSLYRYSPEAHTEFYWLCYALAACLQKVQSLQNFIQSLKIIKIQRQYTTVSFH